MQNASNNYIKFTKQKKPQTNQIARQWGEHSGIKRLINSYNSILIITGFFEVSHH